MNEGLAVFVIVVGILAAVAGLVAGAAYGIARPTCFNQAEVLQMEAQWGILLGCMIETAPGIWMPIEQYFQFENNVGQQRP